MSAAAPLTVAQLVAALTKLPQDAPVFVRPGGGREHSPVLGACDGGALTGNTSLRGIAVLDYAPGAATTYAPSLADYPWLQSLTVAEFEQLNVVDRETLTQVSKDYGAARCVEECARMLRCRKLRLPYTPLGQRYRASRVS